LKFVLLNFYFLRDLLTYDYIRNEIKVIETT